MKQDYDEKLIKSVFDEIKLPDPDLFEKVRSGIQGKRIRKRVSPLRVAAAGVAAVMVLSILVYHTPSMVSYAKEQIGSWFFSVSTDQKQMKMEGEYHALKQTARKTENRYGTMDEIEQMLGVNILQSPLAYSGSEKLIRYSPYPTENGDGLYGAVLMDDLYILGDLQNIKIKDDEDISTVPSIQFDPGKEYRSAVACQVTIRSDLKPDDNYKNLELEYYGSDWKYPEGVKSNTYVSKNLDTEVLLVHMPMDGGSNDSDDSNGAEVRASLTAHFLYDGIQYEFYGRVSESTMKGIIEDLR